MLWYILWRVDLDSYQHGHLIKFIKILREHLQWMYVLNCFVWISGLNWLYNHCNVFKYMYCTVFTTSTSVFFILYSFKMSVNKKFSGLILTPPMFGYDWCKNLFLVKIHVFFLTKSCKPWPKMGMKIGALEYSYFFVLFCTISVLCTRRCLIMLTLFHFLQCMYFRVN